MVGILFKTRKEKIIYLFGLEQTFHASVVAGFLLEVKNHNPNIHSKHR